VCNPRGECATYNGLYLKQDEIEDKVRSGELKGFPHGMLVALGTPEFNCTGIRRG
jgi:hypothetical protein